MADVTSTFAAKDVGFSATVNRMQKTLAGFQSNLGGFATKLAGLAAAFVGVQQSVAAFNSALAMGGRLDDLSKTTGASAGELALLEKAFQLAGSSAEAVGPAIARLNRFMVEASNGGKAQSETMDRLGLSYSQLAGLTPTEQMRLLAKSIMALPTPAERTAAAMDIFGRSGSTLIPLFANFSGELDKAQGYLGSLPGLLDESAGAMADMEDDLGAVGDKFNQFVAGLVAGAAGAENFTSALAKIDTAGIGANLGEQLRVAFDAPTEAAKGIAYTLLTGIAQVGNNLMDALATAGSFFINLISDGSYWEGIGQRATSALLEAVNAFNKLLLYGVEQVFLKPLANLPGIIGDPFRAALDSVQSIREGLEATSAQNYKDWTEGGAKIQEAVDRAAQSTAVISKDWFNVEGWAADAARHFLDAEQRSNTIRENAEKTAENFGKGSAALRDALAEVRGFDLTPKSGSEERPDWFKSNQPPPKNAPAPGADTKGKRGGAATKPQTALDALRTRAEGDASSASALGRIMRDLTKANTRADDLAERGAFFSAARVRQRAEDRANRRATDRNALSLATNRFGGGTMGEAFSNYLQDLRGAGMSTFGETREKFEKSMRDQVKTEAERKAETDRSAAGGGGGAAAAADPLATIVSFLQSTFGDFKERVPQNALTT